MNRAEEERVSLKTQLILIEGLPGAGKTTTSTHLGKRLQRQGTSCCWYLEEDDHHPIACLDLELKDLAERLPVLWKGFVEEALATSAVSIIESRLWQNTALFMYMDEYSVESILGLHRLVWQTLGPLKPILLYLYQSDPEIALHRLHTFRGKEWMEEVLESTTRRRWFRSRGVSGFEGWVRFFEEWQVVAEELLEDWPHRKLRVTDPHNDWGKAYQKIDQFVQLNYEYLLSRSIQSA